MRVENKMAPDAEQMKGFQEPGGEGPIFMVNLLKFKEKAEYEDGRETELTGGQAYALYGQGVSKLIENYGGAAVFGGQVTRLTYGFAEDLWDLVAIAQYPNRQAMLDMITSAEYQECAVHRTAGLEGQLNIETVIPGQG